MEEPDINSPQAEIPDFVIDTLTRCLLPKIQAYFESPEGQAEFEAWKKEQQNTYKKYHAALAFNRQGPLTLAILQYLPDKRQTRTRPRWGLGSDFVALVDDTGLEPVTPCTSSRCSSQLS